MTSSPQCKFFLLSEIQSDGFNSENSIHIPIEFFKKYYCRLRELIGVIFHLSVIVDIKASEENNTNLFYTIGARDIYKLALSIVIFKLWAEIGQNIIVVPSHSSSIPLISSSFLHFLVHNPLAALPYLAWEEPVEGIYYIGFKNSIYLKSWKYENIKTLRKQQPVKALE